VLSFFVCRIPWRIFCSGDFVVTCFSFCLLWMTFFTLSILNDSFAGRVSYSWGYFHSVPEILHSRMIR
jgi:hypothetical protein